MTKPTLLATKRKQNLETNSSGIALLLSLILTTVVLILTTGILTYSTSTYRYSSTSYKKAEATNIAEAGIENTIKELNANQNYSGTTAPVAMTGGEFEVTITGTGQTRTITSTGYIPSKAKPKTKKVVKTSLYISSDIVSFRYAIQSDAGGITLNSNSTINGNVYSNGNVTGNSNAKITGDAYSVGTISSPSPVVNGTKHPSSPVVALPDVDIAVWKTEAAAGGVINGDYNVSGSASIGPKKIQGSVNVNSNGDLTINGPLYITGNLNLNSNSDLFLNNSFGSTGTTIIVDGTINLNSNSVVHNTNTTPKGYILLLTTNTSDGAMNVNSNSISGICYAPYGGITLNSNAKLTALAARKIILNSNATVNYDSGLVNVNYSSGPGGSWVVQKGTWQEVGN